MQENLIKEKKNGVTRFQALQAITDVHEYAHGVWTIVNHFQKENEFEELLRSELSEEGLQCIITAAREKSYPLSLERLQ